MRRSLFVLNVGFLVPLNAAISKLRSEDVVLSMVELARASPVPVKATHKLEACDLLVSKVRYNLQHFTSVSIKSEDFKVHQARLVNALLENECTGSEPANEPLCVLNVVPQMSLYHLKLLLSI